MMDKKLFLAFRWLKYDTAQRQCYIKHVACKAIKQRVVPSFYKFEHFHALRLTF